MSDRDYDEVVDALSGADYDDDDLPFLLKEFAMLKDEQKRVAQQVEDAQAYLLKRMEVEGTERLDTEDGRSVSRVQQVRTEYDLSLMVAELDADTLDRVTVRRVDAKKLASAIELGLVEPDLVERAGSEKLSKPYIRLGSQPPKVGF